MRTRIGICSVCGGNVMAETGLWSGMNPPPPAECENCHAIAQDKVIHMIKRPEGK